MKSEKIPIEMPEVSWFCEETVLANKMVFGMSFNAAKVLFVDLRPGWPGYLISRGGRVRAY